VCATKGQTGAHVAAVPADSPETGLVSSSRFSGFSSAITKDSLFSSQHDYLERIAISPTFEKAGHSFVA